MAYLFRAPKNEDLISPCPTLSAHTEFISQGHCWLYHHEAESHDAYIILRVMVGKGLTTKLYSLEATLSPWCL